MSDYQSEELSVNASLGADIHVQNLQCSSFRYEGVSGLCNILVKSLNVDDLRGYARSSGMVYLSGKAKNHHIVSTGDATIMASELDAQNTSIMASGRSRVFLGNSNSADVNAKEKSRIFTTADMGTGAGELV